VVDLEENKEKILPMLSKLQQAEKKQPSLAKRNNASNFDYTNLKTQ